MLLDRIELHDFRNYARQVCDFSPRVNIFFGDNAQGKTNLLEAIYLLGLGKSFRAAQDRELIRHHEMAFRVIGTVRGESFPLDPSSLEIAYDGTRKSLKLNGVAMRRQADLLGMLRLVLFAPEDLQLVKGGPAHRRQFLDLGLAQSSRKFREALFRFSMVLAQRNRLLKEHAGRMVPADQLDPWDDQLVEYGSQVMKGRVLGLRSLIPIASQYHSRVSNGAETLKMQYISASRNIDPFQPDGNIAAVCAESLRENLNQCRREEAARGITLAGPHRDDLSISLMGQGEIRTFGSQGQARTATLALKMSMVEFIREQTGDYPLLLLDDVLSEFDDQRKAALLQTVIGVTQTFVSTTTSRILPPDKDARAFRVCKGAVEPCPD